MAIFYSGLYAYGVFLQRFNLKWYFLKPKKIHYAIIFGIIFGIFYLGALGSWLWPLPALWISIYLFSFLILTVFPINLYRKIRSIYVDLESQLPQKMFQTSDFGPYIIPHSDNEHSINILWGSLKPRKKKAKSNVSKNYKISKTLFLGFDLDALQEYKGEIYLDDKNIILFHFNFEFQAKDRLEFPGFYYRISEKNQDYFVQWENLPLKESQQLPPAKNSHNFEFVAVSDLHADENTIFSEVQVISHISPHARFVISGGDNISKGKKTLSWAYFFAQWGSFLATRPLLSCPGNHDAESHKKSVLWQKFLPYKDPQKAKTWKRSHSRNNYYSIQYQNLFLMFLDTYNAGNSPRIPNISQMKQLHADLALHKSIPIKILIMHNSIYCTGEFGCDRDLERLLIPIINQFKIQVILSGHAHILEFFKRPLPDNIHNSLFIVNGGGGGKLDEILLSQKSFPTVPYKWESRIHQVKEKPYFAGNSSHPFRNDLKVKQYQEMGQIIHAWTRFQIEFQENSSIILKITSFDWSGKELYNSILEIGPQT